VAVKITIFSDMMLILTCRMKVPLPFSRWRNGNEDVPACYLVDIYERFFVPHCLHLQGKRYRRSVLLKPTGELGFDSR
jgi:hypothetical protein